MEPIKIAVLYICTGRYHLFWSDFYKNAESYLLKGQEYEKHYFVFTDAETIEYENLSRVHKIYQEPLEWPYITLLRFKIFKKVLSQLEGMDYIYFFNANMLVIESINEEILPSEMKSLVFVKHPGFFDKTRNQFTYDHNPKSLAYVGEDEGDTYFMGGLNGGTAQDYLAMIEELDSRVDEDLHHNIVALWHDESHLNRYAIDHSEKVQTLDPSFGYPEGWNIPFKPKILIRDKNKYGGHDFLRNTESFVGKILRRLTSW